MLVWIYKLWITYSCREETGKLYWLTSFPNINNNVLIQYCCSAVMTNCVDPGSNYQGATTTKCSVSNTYYLNCSQLHDSLWIGKYWSSSQRNITILWTNKGQFTTKPQFYLCLRDGYLWVIFRILENMRDWDYRWPPLTSYTGTHNYTEQNLKHSVLFWLKRV